MSKPNSCPLCDHQAEFTLETDTVWGNKTGVDRAFYHCDNCDVFFQWPRLTADEEERFYRDEFEKFMEGRNNQGGMDWTGPEKHIQSNQEQRDRRERYLSEYYAAVAKRDNPTLLEVGCSSGFMLYGIEEKYGIKPFGVEPSGAFSTFLKEKNIPAYASLEELKAKAGDQKFDLITHYFVLEHIQEPKEFVLDLFGMLKPQGTLIMEIPNAADPLRTVYPTQAFKEFYWSIAHPWYFTEKSLNYLMKDMCGLSNYRIMGDQRYDIGNHTKWLREGKPGGQGGLAKVFDSDFDHMFRQQLIKAGLCDTAVVFVEKE